MDVLWNSISISSPISSLLRLLQLPLLRLQLLLLLLLPATTVFVDGANVGLAHAAAKNSNSNIDGNSGNSPAPVYFTAGLFLGIVLTAFILHYCYWRPKDRAGRNEWSLQGTSNDDKTIVIDEDVDVDGSDVVDVVMMQEEEDNNDADEINVSVNNVNNTM